ncbi:MAG: methylenetetrahydrofolate reductase [Treponema sp.]|jgi:methylenetetrahydrofolate reductase (NADPH)|nr:methylenetetrahydrofolate reductase [Treponema sp.]
MEISLELVPRSPSSLRKDAILCASRPVIGGVNVPDLSRFSLRSWEACGILADAFSGAGGAEGPALCPHLRARDFSLEEPFPLGDFFRSRGIRRALVIAGDFPGGEGGEAVPPGERGERSPTVSFIKKLKAELPELDLYAAFDPYRTNIRYELDYLAAKEEAGASGFMSQPFFDLRLLEIYAEYLEGKRVFWGVAPVLTAGNRRYWELRNRAVFPRSFRPDLFWNITFARQVLDFCKQGGFNLYLMPIRMDLSAYLSGIWPQADE